MTPIHCAYCGAQASGPDVLVSRSLCYCDASCEEYGDCCGDYSAVCGG